MKSREIRVNWLAVYMINVGIAKIQKANDLALMS
jgi:hypothetical protein